MSRLAKMSAKFIFFHFFFLVPPNQPIIRNQNGQEMLYREAGPYEVGDNLILDCEVSGGK